MTGEAPVHYVSFQRNTINGLWRARCAGCGWIGVGEEEEVKRRAATHDMEWVDEPPGQFEAAAIMRDSR